MSKKAIILLMGILLIVSVAFADEPQATIQSMTELGEIQKKLDQGITIEKVYYTDGYGFSTSEFSTDDPEEIAQLWRTVNAITVGKRVDESITDWYPQIVFYLSDGTRGGVRFEAQWLCIGGMENYEISNADEFWELTSVLVQKHAAMEEGSFPDGWNEKINESQGNAPDANWDLPETIDMTEAATSAFDKAVTDLVGVDYEPLGLLGEKDGLYCILCRATVVYPGAKPYYALVYVNEAGIQNIWDIWMDAHSIRE